jgi:hypothetical protein
MQEPRGYKMPLLGRGIAEGMVNVFANSAKFYWRMWGPLGEPIIRATEEWANTQRRYLQSLREAQQSEGQEVEDREVEAREEPQAAATAEADLQEPQAATTTTPEIQADAEEPPIEDYDSLNVNQVTQRLGELSVEEIERLREYEAKNKNRRSLMQRFDTRIGAAREGRGGA